MNFLKWILNILFGWIMDIPFQKMNWASIKEFLLVPKTPVGTILPVQKVYLDSIFGISIFLGLAVIFTSNYCNISYYNLYHYSLKICEIKKSSF